MRWNTDPLLIAALVALAFFVGRGHSSDQRAGWGAIAVMFVVFVSPLCALSSALFSARVLHHILLVAAVAPLLAARVSRSVVSVLRRSRRWLRHMPSFCGSGTRRSSMPGVSLRADLLADADFAARQRLADVAGDPCDAGSIGADADGACGDDRADGTARRVDRVRAAPAVFGAFCEHRGLGDHPARRPATRGAADVGTGDAALSRGRHLDCVVEPAFHRTSV